MVESLNWIGRGRGNSVYSFSLIKSKKKSDIAGPCPGFVCESCGRRYVVNVTAFLDTALSAHRPASDDRGSVRAKRRAIFHIFVVPSDTYHEVVGRILEATFPGPGDPLSCNYNEDRGKFAARMVSRAMACLHLEGRNQSPNETPRIVGSLVELVGQVYSSTDLAQKRNKTGTLGLTSKRHALMQPAEGLIRYS
jgi:hypothetical protein